jgi:hypothetical protein
VVVAELVLEADQAVLPVVCDISAGSAVVLLVLVVTVLAVELELELELDFYLFMGHRIQAGFSAYTHTLIHTHTHTHTVTHTHTCAYVCFWPSSWYGMAIGSSYLVYVTYCMY